MNKKLAKIFHRPDFQAGDVVKSPLGNYYKIYEVFENYLACEDGVSLYKSRHPKLIQPKVDLSDVLEKMNEKKKLIKYDQKVGLTLCSDEVIYILENWRLKKDGKTLDLWDQSEETQKFVETILKPKE